MKAVGVCTLGGRTVRGAGAATRAPHPESSLQPSPKSRASLWPYSALPACGHLGKKSRWRLSLKGVSLGISSTERRPRPTKDFLSLALPGICREHSLSPQNLSCLLLRWAEEAPQALKCVLLALTFNPAH